MARALFVLIMGMMILTAGCNSIEVVQPSEVGVVFNRFTGDFGDPLMPGTYLVDPLSDEITIYSTAQQELTLAAGSSDPYSAVNVVFADGEEAHVDVTIFYSVDPASVNGLFSRWQDRYENGFVVPTVRSVIYHAATNYTAQQFLETLGAGFKNDVRSKLGSDLANEGLILNDFVIRGVEFSKEFTDRVEHQLMTATAEAITATPSP